MKPSTTPLDPESWRHNDTALRRALEQRNAELPQLPEGFAERMEQRLEAEESAAAASAAKTPAATAKKRPLGPWFSAAAAAIAAALVLGLFISQPQVSEPVGLEENSEPLAAVLEENSEPVAVGLQENSGPLAEVSEKHLPSGKAHGTQHPSHGTAAASQSSDSATEQTPPTTPEETAETEQEETPVEDVSQPATSQPSSTETPTTIPSVPTDFPSLPPTTKSSHSRTLHLALYVAPTAPHSTTDLNSSDLNDFDVMHNSANANRPNDDKYYLTAGEGYTYAAMQQHPADSMKSGASHTRADNLTRSSTDSPTSPEDVWTNGISHYRPITIAARLNIPLSQHLALETGLSYTSLRSTAERQFPAGSDHGPLEQRLGQAMHYFGVPLLVEYDFLQHKVFQAYATAGFSLDIPFYTHRTVLLYEQRDMNDTWTVTRTYSHPKAPFQLAPTVGLGVQLNLSRHAALFIQPSLHYFFSIGAGEENYRTEHPLSVTIPFGFRWTL